MDPVCVVSGQCACTDRLVVLYTRWFMIKAKFFDHTLLPRDENVYYASTPTFSFEQESKASRYKAFP